jgi:hypothetical protein
MTSAMECVGIFSRNELEFLQDILKKLLDLHHCSSPHLDLCKNPKICNPFIKFQIAKFWVKLKLSTGIHVCLNHKLLFLLMCDIC